MKNDGLGGLGGSWGRLGTLWASRGEKVPRTLVRCTLLGYRSGPPNRPCESKNLSSDSFCMIYVLFCRAFCPGLFSRGLWLHKGVVPGGADVQSVHAGAVQITFSKFSKSDLRDHFWDHFGAHLGRVWDHFGACWAHFGTLGRFLNKKRGSET